MMSILLNEEKSQSSFQPNFQPNYKNSNRLYSLSSNKPKKDRLMSKEGNLITLLEKMSVGDEVAMGSFYDATVNRVYGMAMKVVLRPELAEEVVSDVYLQVWRQASKYRSQRATPIGWLLMICRSRALDKLRREKSATRNQYQEDDQREIEDENIEAPMETIMKGDLSKQVSAALRVLTKSQRQTIALAFYRGMSHQEIADYTRQPLGTVKSNIRRAQAILRKSLDSNDFSTGGIYGEA